LERNLEKEAFCTFLEHKSEENGKVSNFLAGTVRDGVKPLYMTASRVTKEVDMANTHDDPELFLCLGPDGVTKAVRVQLHMTAQSNSPHDGVTNRSRQYDFIKAAS
jgi:hypothetical protein